MPGVVFGPELKSPQLIKINHGTPRFPNQRTKKKSTPEERRSRQAKQKVLRDERLARRKQMRLLREWLRERPCEEVPVSPQKTEKKTKRGSHHGTEEVTSQVGNYLKFRKADIL